MSAAGWLSKGGPASSWLALACAVASLAGCRHEVPAETNAVLVGRGASYCSGLEVDETAFYWTDYFFPVGGNFVGRWERSVVPEEGCTSSCFEGRTFMADVMEMNYLVGDANYVYVCSHSNGGGVASLRRIPKGPGFADLDDVPEPEVIAGPGACNGMTTIAIDGSTLYWVYRPIYDADAESVVNVPHIVERVDTGSLDKEVLFEQAEPVDGLAIHEGRLFGRSKGCVSEIPEVAGGVRVCPDWGGWADEYIAVDGRYVYFATIAQAQLDDFSELGTVWRGSFETGEVEAFAERLEYPRAIVYHDGYVYFQVGRGTSWAVHGSTRLMRKSVTGTRVEEVAYGLNWPQLVRFLDGDIFWCDFETGRIETVPIPAVY